MAKTVSHTVTRPGRKDGDAEVDIPVAEDLATVPGVPQNPVDVAFYSREHPLETQSIDKSADRQWAWTAQADDLTEFREAQEERMEPLYKAALVSGDVEPTGTPVPGEDLTNDIRRFAREIGFGEVGFTRYDRHYTFKGKKRWAKYQHAICLAVEQEPLNRPRRLPTDPDLAHKARMAHALMPEVMRKVSKILTNGRRPRAKWEQIKAETVWATIPPVDEGRSQMEYGYRHFKSCPGCNGGGFQD